MGPARECVDLGGKHISDEGLGKMRNPIEAIKELYSDTVADLKKCSWPTRRELKGETIACVSFLILMAAFLFVADQFFMMAIKMICM